jgi:RNA polymerase sigma factor (sigma-70 family)
MCDALLQPRDKPDMDHSSTGLLCCSNGCWDSAAITTVVAIRSDLGCLWPVEWLDDAAIVLAVQSYLHCRKAGRPAAAHQEQAWDRFYREYHPLVRRTVAVSCRFAAQASERDDLSQEVWGEIVAQLPKLTYNPARANLSSWLVGLICRKVRRVSNAMRPPHSQYFLGVENLIEALKSQDLGPEDICFMGEVLTELESALAKFRKRTSAKTYELFYRRFFWGQSVKEVAALLDLSPNEVRCRYHRALKKWQSVAKGLSVLGRTGGSSRSYGARSASKPR